MKNVNIRIDNIEVRPYKGVVGMNGDTVYEYEFVKWRKDSQGKDYCYVLSFAEASSDDYDINSVSNRPWELNDDEQHVYNVIVKMFFELIEKF